MTARPNILLVVADDHAANAVGAYGGPQRVTPRIDGIAEHGIRFDACGFDAWEVVPDQGK